MDLHELIRALLTNDMLTAREWVAEAERMRFRWASIPRPAGMDAIAMAVAAGVVEMLASRSSQEPPSWTAAVPAASESVFLVRAALRMPRLREMCEREGPEPLRRRRILAPPDFLTAA